MSLEAEDNNWRDVSWKLGDLKTGSSSCLMLQERLVLSYKSEKGIVLMYNKKIENRNIL